jgi:hypothetical protein
MKVKPAMGRFFATEEDCDGHRPHTIVGVAGPDLLSLPRSLDAESPQIYRPTGLPV